MRSEETKSIGVINQSLAAALGVADPSRCTKVVLTLSPRDLPRVEASFWLNGADGVRQVVEAWDLVPQRTLSQATPDSNPIGAAA